jgi:hypothetical protein
MEMETLNFETNIVSQPTNTTPSISSSAMLVELNISLWTGRKFDKTVSQEIDTQKHTTTRAGNYHKKLFADEPKFEAITKFAGNARTTHYYQTMPWSDSGLRLLTTPLFFEYNKKMTEADAEFNRLVGEFINDYDNMIARAHGKLGNLFNPEDYPALDEVADKYNFRLKYSPVPEVGDFRVDVGQDAIKQLNESYANYYQEQINNAYKDVWQRTYDALKSMSDKLAGDNKQIFRDTLVTNVTGIVELLDKFNVTNDDTMRKAKLKITDTLRGITPDALREDDYLRHDTKRKVDDLLKEFVW